MDVAGEKSCVHYPICYLLIIKYIYANLIFASDLLSDSVAFASRVHPELEKDIGEVNVLI